VFVTRWGGGGGSFTIFIIWYSIFYTHAYISSTRFSPFILLNSKRYVFSNTAAAAKNSPLFLLHAYDGSHVNATASELPPRAWPRLQDNKMSLHVCPIKTALRPTFFSQCSCAAAELPVRYVEEKTSFTHWNVMIIFIVIIIIYKRRIHGWFSQLPILYQSLIIPYFVYNHGIMASRNLYFLGTRKLLKLWL